MPRSSSSTPAKGKKANMVNLADKDSHFRGVSRGLGFLRHHEGLTDFRFVCKQSGAKKPKVVLAHKAVFADKSKLMKEMFDICKAETPGQDVYITLEETDSLTVEKLMDYLYLGQATVKQERKTEMDDLCQRLGMDITLDRPEETESSSADTEEEEKKEEEVKPKKKNRDVSKDKVKEQKEKETPKSQKKRGRQMSKKSDSENSDTEEPKKDESKKQDGLDLDSLKEKAQNSKSSITLEPVEKSSDSEIQRLMKTIKSAGTKANPLFAGKNSKPAAPQKRRMNESDKKVETKDSKKMRQDDSSSEVDSDAVAKRKSEVPSQSTNGSLERRRKSGSRNNDSSDSEEEVAKPKRKQPEKKDPEKDTPKRKIEESSKKSRRRSSIASGAAAASDSDASVSSAVSKKKPAPSPPITPSLAKKKGKPKIDDEPPRKRTDNGGDDSDASEKPSAKKAGPLSAKKKPGPKPGAKKQKKAPVASELFATEAIQYCNQCGAILVSSEALKRHKETAHGGDDSDSNDSSSVSSESSEATSSPKKAVKKTPEKIKEERRQSKRSEGEDDQSEDEKPAPKPKSKPRRSETNGSTDAGDKKYGCNYCDETFEKSNNLKNHSLNHFKESLLPDLPSAKPYTCPKCQSVSRDKITLLRHYAFGHKTIFKFTTEEELAGRKLDGSTMTPSASAKKKPGREKAKAASSDSEPARKKAGKPKEDKASDASDSEPARKKGTEKQSTPPLVSDSPSSPVKPQISNVKFSDDSDDDGFAKASATKAIKNFDDLFGGEAAEKNGGGDKKEKENKKSKVVFNKDSDGTDSD